MAHLLIWLIMFLVALDVPFDSVVSFTEYVNDIRKSFVYEVLCVMFLRISLANALVSSHLDYCNSLLVCIIKSNMMKLS